MSDYDRCKVAAKDSDARAAKFLAKWSKAEADRLDNVLNNFNGLDLANMRQSFVHMQGSLKHVVEADPKDGPRYLKDTRTQNTGYWASHRQKRVQAMFENIKTLKQFIADWERAMKP